MQGATQFFGMNNAGVVQCEPAIRGRGQRQAGESQNGEVHRDTAQFQPE